MKREFLKNLGITDEQIDGIMAEHGKTVEKAKGDATKVTQELETYKDKVNALETQLTDANTQIQSFKDMDIDGIKKSADEWKSKYEADTKELQMQMEAKEYGYNLDKAMTDYKFSNDRVKNSILADIKEKQFKFENEKFLGLEDYMKQLQDSEPTSFITEEPKEPTPQIVKPTGSASGANTGRKMSLVEAMKLKNNNPDLSVDF
ncbi:MAG: phage scaffolding protein [Paraclostridium sp.]